VTEFRPATRDDAIWVGRNLCPADIQELNLAGAPGPVQATVESVAASKEAWSYRVNDFTEGVCGYVPYVGQPGVATIWALSTAWARGRPIEYARASTRMLATILAKVPEVRNMVWAENWPTVAWLEWLGAEFADAIQLPSGAWFRPFTIRRRDPCAGQR